MNKFFKYFVLAAATACTVSLSSCDKDDDDDQPNNSNVPADTTTNNTPSENNNNNNANSSIVGTWIINEAETEAANASSLGGFEDDEEEDVMNFNQVTFNADGTFVTSNGGAESLKGTYSVSGSELSMSGVQNGKKVTLAKGAVLMETELFGVKMKITIKENSFVIKGDKMTMTQVVETEAAGEKDTEMNVTIFDRKK